MTGTGPQRRFSSLWKQPHFLFYPQPKLKEATMLHRFAIGAFAALLLCYFGGHQSARRLEEDGYFDETPNNDADNDIEYEDEPAKPDYTNPYINLLDDGTLLVKQMPESVACSYFTQLPNLPKRVDASPTRIHYHFDDCSDDNLGVQLAEHFGHYLLANAAQVPYTMTCGNGQDQGGTVMKLLQIDNENPGPPPMDVTGHQHSVYDVCFACYGLSWWCDKGPELMAGIIINDLWKLANSDLGNAINAEDAVVHLRLGDAVSSGKDEGTGLLPFRSYSRLLRRAQNERGPLHTISILTQAFDPNALRLQDRPHVERSSWVAQELLNHLREEFPNAHVVLHNDPGDSPQVSYIRLMKASKVAICGASTFCTYPVVANQAIRYLYESDKLNPWVKRLKYMENVHSFATNRLASNYAGSLSDKQLLHWLRHQDPNGQDDITSPPLFRVPKTRFAYS